MGNYLPRAEGVPARLYRATGDQIFVEDTLQLEKVVTFQIRHRRVDSTDLIEWQGRRLEIRGIVDLVPRRWIQLDCRDSE